MSTVVRLGNQSFTYNNTESDHNRRKLYFKGASGATLDPLEKAILKSLGVDGTMEKSLAPYLADFFKLLPSCSSDTSLLLSKQCELPHFVLWSILFANKDSIQSRIANGANNAPSNLNVANIQGLLSEIRSGMPSDMPGAVPSAPPAQQQGQQQGQQQQQQQQQPSTNTPLPATNENDAAINKLFTLIFPEQAQTTEEDQAIERLFTLIINDPVN